MGKGCKIALIIFGILVVIVLAAIVVSMIYCEKIGVAVLQKGVDLVEAKALEDLPAQFDEDQVKAEFQAFREALDAGVLSDKGNTPELERLGRRVQRALDDDEIDAEELEQILESMREISSSVKE
jgi:hypothetical protein